MELEYKTVPFEFKEADGGEGAFDGYGAVFGNIDDGHDILMEGAFTKMHTKKGSDRIRIAAYHDTRMFIGDGVPSQNKRGLKISKGQLNHKLSYVPDIHELMLDGTLDSMSVGFTIPKGGSKWRDDGVREIYEAELYEVSIVPFGMNRRAKITSVKSADGVHDIREYEQFLFDSGYTRQHAKALASGGFKALMRDAGKPDGHNGREGASVDLSGLKQAVIDSAVNYSI